MNCHRPGGSTAVRVETNCRHPDGMVSTVGKNRYRQGAY
jgi:hypothetical protein